MNEHERTTTAGQVKVLLADGTWRQVDGLNLVSLSGRTYVRLGHDLAELGKVA